KGHIRWKTATSHLTGRIVGGRDAKKEIPHMLRLTIGGLFCGATLVQSSGLQFGLTAAHCVVNIRSSPSSARIIAGDYSLYYFANEQYRSPTKIVIHEQFNPKDKDLNNDIALMFFAPFKVNSFVKPIKLPGYMWDVPGYVQISGWGSTAPEPNLKNPDILQVADIHTVRRDCERFSNFGTTWRQICVQDDGVGSCIGDSGGPAIARNGSNSRKYVAGIASYGLGSCGSDLPAVCTRVSAYVNWIQVQLTKQKG
ncbi:Trypsin-1, partial [Orchesella cincta]